MQFRSYTNYCASLAHKTNHSFVPNRLASTAVTLATNIIMLIPYSLLSHQFLSEFVVFDHPRFGVIPCIASIHSIAAGEEIFVRCRTKLWNELSIVSFKINFPRYGYDLDYCPDWYLQAWESGKISQTLNCLQTQNVLQLMASWQTRIYGSNSLDD